MESHSQGAPPGCRGAGSRARARSSASAGPPCWGSCNRPPFTCSFVFFDFQCVFCFKPRGPASAPHCATGQSHSRRMRAPPLAALLAAFGLLFATADAVTVNTACETLTGLPGCTECSKVGPAAYRCFLCHKSAIADYDDGVIYRVG